MKKFTILLLLLLFISCMTTQKKRMTEVEYNKLSFTEKVSKCIAPTLQAKYKDVRFQRKKELCQCIVVMEMVGQGEKPCEQPFYIGNYVDQFIERME